MATKSTTKKTHTRNKKQNVTVQFIATQEQKDRWDRAIEACPNKAVKNRTDLITYVLDTYCEAIGVD